VVLTEELTRTIEARIKETDAWHVCAQEPYGAFNLAPDAKLERLLYCVTASPAAVEYFKKHGYDAMVTHHPIMAREKEILTPEEFFQESVSSIPQLVYHTALDCCEGGLNDYWRDFLGVKDAKHFDVNLGWAGQIDPISFKQLKDKIETKLESPMIGDIFNSQKEINSIVICTGLGGAVNQLALKTDADCYILGQSIVPVDRAGFRNVIEMGHTLSERIGYDCIKNFIKHLPVQMDMIPLEKDICAYGETSRIQRIFR
jgi:putative NIF3 family GTP cyclohydrolase 1 type 2